MLLKLSIQPIRAEDALAAVRHPSCGGVALFEGNIRDHHEGKKVVALEYEVHEPLLRAELERIVAEARACWPFREVAILQRIGRLAVGETGIVIAVSSPHRREALAACAFLIEAFKKRAPVWKKEFYAAGEPAWVNCAH